MSLYQVRIKGCDETTEFLMDLDAAALAVVERVAAASRYAAAHDRFPRLTVTPEPVKDPS